MGMMQAADRSRGGVWLKAALLVALLVAGVLVWLVVGIPDPASLHAAIRRWGAWAPVVFVVGYALITLTPVPKGVLSVAAGLAFGWLTGAALVYVAALLGAGLAFGIGRLLGRDAVERLTGTRAARVDQLLARRGVVAVLAVRLVPLLPFTAINYGAGLSSVRRRDYALGTAVGIIPGTLSYVALGSGAASGHRWLVLVAAAVLVLLSAVAATGALKRRHSSVQPTAAPDSHIGDDPGEDSPAEGR